MKLKKTIQPHFNMKYEKQLLTVEWKLKAMQIKFRDSNTCQICGCYHNLHVHHVVYESNLLAWQYPDNYYVTLCEVCHIYEHGIIDNIKHLPEIKELLLSGMMGIDIYKKYKSKEPVIYTVPF